jgi:histidine ammonia-lyase
MTLEALFANLKPYDLRLHELRGFAGRRAQRDRNHEVHCRQRPGQTGKIKTKVQDAYSMRSSPQVIGAAHDAAAYAAARSRRVERRGRQSHLSARGALTLTGANFQGTPVALPMDMAGAAITMVCVLSERRLNRLTNPALSVGLPPS